MVAWKKVLPVLALGAFAFLVVVPAAFADSFSFSVSGSTQISLNSPNDNYWGDYETRADAFGTTSVVHAVVPNVGDLLEITNDSFYVPVGSTITSASLELILPTGVVNGTSQLANVTSERLPPPDPGNPTHTAPTFANPGTASLNPFSFVNGRGGSNGVFDLLNVPVVSGNEISTGDLSLELTGASGQLAALVATQGFNYAGYVDGTGEVDLPYTLELVGTYTPAACTPEPSGLVLLATGVLAMLAAAWYRRTASC